MGFFDLFRRAPPIRDGDALAEFIDEHAAFLVQKGLYEYSRARSGYYSKVLFTEPAFQEAMQSARWRAYPLGLGMVGELVEGVLRPSARDDRPPVQQAVAAIVLGVFDRYPTPESVGAAAWAQSREDLAQRLAQVAMHPPKPAKDIPEPYAESYLALMPIHERLRAPDHPALRNYLRVTLCNIHDKFVQRLDAPALAAALGVRTT